MIAQPGMLSAMIESVDERHAMRRLRELIMEFIGEFVLWMILAITGAGVVVGVSALLNRPWLTEALVTSADADITLLAIIGLVALIGAIVAITWSVRKIKKKVPPTC
ncbi:hypothetical protein [Microtetraspora sp. NBRC 16547]|uniref:hypothetical protein n=1 Tax=Microtetraspora sp. NBRC 16547 TaxID=3030993 RepID=UPI0024A3454C|nr:hypothetical protein [Microtetraspora sp. NBRC 16547]GLX01547.1 hypothetical protein Misp02_56330 [Microtetraspora sp. NBRC 16547]